MEVWGLTGIIGSGKSTALKILTEMAFPTLDLDQAARHVVDPRSPAGKNALQKLGQQFGSDVLLPDGSLNRQRLKEKMLQDPSLQLDIEKFLHPLIWEQAQAVAAQWKAQGHALAFFEGTRLVESGFHRELKGLIWVHCAPELRRQRLAEREQMSLEVFEALMKLQNEEAMKKAADVKWENSHGPDQLKAQILQFLEERKNA